MTGEDTANIKTAFRKKSTQRERGKEKCKSSNKIYCFTVTYEVNADKKYILSGRTSN